MARSEADKLSMAPIVVTLGNKSYEIQLLRTLKQREWRKLLVEQLGAILGNFSMNMEQAGMNVFKGGLVSALVHSPEKVADLLFAYAPDLPREIILEESTEEQIVSAFGSITEVAYPFTEVLRLTTAILSTEISASPKPASSTLQ